MSSFKTFTMGAAALAVTLGTLSTPAAADDKSWSYVKDMVLLSSQVPEIVVKNTAGNHLLSNLNLAVQDNTIAVPVGGAVDCLGTTFENAFQRRGAYLSKGAFGIGRTSLLMKKDLPSSNDLNHVSDMDAHTFQMPKNLLADPQIGLDPEALVLAEADKAPDRLQYLRQDHVIMATLPIRWESTCWSYTRYKVKKDTVQEADPNGSFMTKDVPVKIVYQGDPQLFAVNAKIANSPAMQGGFKAADQPLKITQMTFQPNLPSHVGACPKKVPMRVNYTGQGKGDIRIRIGFGNTPKHESQVIAFDSKNGPQHYDFELETPYIQNNNLNNTIQYNLRVFVRGKDANAQAWPNTYQLMDSAVWKVRCTPQVNPVLGGGAVGGVKQGGGASPSPAVRPKRAVPVDPTPSRPARAD
jgi:hypothetical protein